MGKSQPTAARKSKQPAQKSPADEPAPRTRAAAQKRHYLPAEERRRRILEAARDVFAHSGLQGSRTRDLAQAAGINQATLFGHFGSKEELFVAAVLQPLTDSLTGIRERYQAYEAADSTENLLALLQGNMQKHLQSMVEIFPLLVQALFSDRELGKKLYREQIEPIIKTRSQLVRNVIKETIDPELIELASFGMFFAVAMDRVMTGKTNDLSNVSQQLCELILFGGTRQNITSEAAPRAKNAKKKRGARSSGKK